MLQFFIGAFNEDYQISEEIRNGLINQFLLKPINYFLYRFSIFCRPRGWSPGALVLVPLLRRRSRCCTGLSHPAARAAGGSRSALPAHGAVRR